VLFTHCQANSLPPDFFNNEDHEPGMIKINDDGDQLFYWLFRSRNNPKTDPLVFWL